MLKGVSNVGDTIILQKIVHERKHAINARIHNSSDCTATKKKRVNCMFKIRTYNLTISDEHDTLSPECPTFKRTLQEEKRRAGWEDAK